MELDLSKCRIHTPTGDELLRLYRMVMEVFVGDRPVFAEMIEKGRRFYTWTPYTLYLGNELLGNVSLMPMRIWLEGRITQTVGIASVATPKRYRRMGVAKHLMGHCLGVIDRQKMPAVLLTNLPGMYQWAGFEAVDQAYPAASTRQVDFAKRGFDCKLLETLAEDHLEEMARLYAQEYPNYDGKVVRDPDYWQLYQMLFNPYPKIKVLFCIRDGRVLGYARLELEDDRLLVSEICGDASGTDVAETLLGFMADYARQVGRDLVTFALPPDHFAKQILNHHDVQLQPEPPGAHRETFMVRPRAGELLGPLERLQWSLADKF